MPKKACFNEAGQNQCSNCKVYKDTCDYSVAGVLKSGLPRLNSWCKVCIAGKQASYHRRTWGPEKLAFTAYKRTQSPRHYLHYLLTKARQRSKICTLTLDYLESLYTLQKGKCALTGWDMTFELGKGSVPTNMSIDRINSGIGYEAGNVQLVCRAANIAKSSLSMAEFKALCRAVVENVNAEERVSI